jgi:2-C-methyl-D-erythritol 4-phosphate cytidylyltransferase
MLGYQVSVFEGSPRNIKVTTAADLAVVEALLAQSRVR